MSLKVIIGTICKCGYLAPSKWKEIFEVTSSLGIMRKSICWNLHKSYFFFCETKRLCEELLFIHEPFFKMLTISTRLTKVFNLYLFKFSCSEYCIFWSDFITKCFSTLCYPERDFLASGSSNICKVYKYTLCCLWTKVDKRG